MSDTEAKIITQSITQLLARREHSQHELLQKLARKEFDSDLCQQVLAKFTARGLQSDQRYAEGVVRNAYRKGKGPNNVSQILEQQNIDPFIINEYLYSDEFDWFALAQQVRLKKYKGNTPTDWQEKQKQMRFLQYRGFTSEHIKYSFE